MGPRTGMDDIEKRKILPLPGHEVGHLGRSARSQSLYRLSYPGSRRNRLYSINQTDAEIEKDIEKV
jgi:hypothetical protein